MQCGDRVSNFSHYWWWVLLVIIVWQMEEWPCLGTTCPVDKRENVGMAGLSVQCHSPELNQFKNTADFQKWLEFQKCSVPIYHHSLVCSVVVSHGHDFIVETYNRDSPCPERCLIEVVRFSEVICFQQCPGIELRTLNTRKPGPQSMDPFLISTYCNLKTPHSLACKPLLLLLSLVSFFTTANKMHSATY